jgi:hypothetical protein
MTAVGGGFELDQLLAACADLAKRTQQQEEAEEASEQQQQEQHRAEQGLGATPEEDSDDGDALYADLLQPTGITNGAGHQ